MANTSNIDSDKIISTAASMEKEISVVHSCAQKFSDAMLTLDKQWISESKTVLMQSFNSDLEAMNELAEQMSEFCDLLRNMANSYDSSEKDIADKIKALPKL